MHRIGQTNNVNVHYLVAKGSADDHLWCVRCAVSSGGFPGLQLIYNLAYLLILQAVDPGKNECFGASGAV